MNSPKNIIPVLILCILFPLSYSVEVVRAASKVLKNILATHTGFEFASQYKKLVQDHLLQYVHTFRTSKNKVHAVILRLSFSLTFIVITRMVIS